MFGSKNKQQKNQAEISIETMEGNLKGESKKTSVVEYEKTNTITDVKGNSMPGDNTAPNTVQKADVGNVTNQADSFKSPFKGGDLPIGEPGSAEKGNIGQGSFSAPMDNLTTEVPKKEESTFLHQAIDGEIETNNKSTNREAEIVSEKKNGGMSSFLLIILFIALLAGIIYGGYYFYMKKEAVNPKAKESQQPNKQIEKVPSKPKTPIKKTTQTTTAQKKETQTTPKIEKLITSTETFNKDLAQFVLSLKKRRSTVELQNGIFISPMTSVEQGLSAKKLLEALHMTIFFDQIKLKDSCKLFMLEDNGNIKVAVIFELSEGADEKLIKDSIMRKEKELMTKMSYLFVDGTKPVVPTKINFTVNKSNMQARYANYTPGVDTFSVDWNILSLGKGKLVYFATSRKTAKVLTDYFIRTVTK